MKKLLLLVLLLFSFIGTTSAGEVEIRKLKESNTCVNCDLRQANLSWENLSGANLSWSDLKGANLRGVNLTGANLTGAYLAKANLESSKLSKANLEQTNLKEANLKGANLKGANLKGAYLYRADLTNANLIGVNLTEANLTGANLTGAIKKEEKTSETLKKEQDLIALELEVSRLWEEGSGKTRNEIRKELKNKIINGGYKSFTSMNEMELEISRLWEEGDGQKTRREIRKELKEKIKNGGYKSLALMKKEEERKKKEEETITAAINKEEKRIEIYINKFKGFSTKLKDLELDSLKVEVDELISEVEANTSSDLNVLKGLNKTLREMNSSVELKIKTEESKQRVLSLKDYPGFRDLKPGLHYEDLTEFCHLRKGYWVKCYGIDNIKFYGKFKNDVLYELILDMGPIVNTEGFLSVFGENDSNILIKMRKTMDKNYSRDYGYSERDRQLFNESEKSRLYEVYSGGKVVLEINRKEKDWSSDLWLYIHYLDPSKAETFLNENRPVRATDDDF